MTTRRTAHALALAAALAVAAPFAASAQESHSGHGTAAPAAPVAPAGPAAEGYMKAMDTMHAAMAAMPSSGDADVDFVRGMIPHHQAAIDMARVQLQYGTDPGIRKLSEAIIAAQEKEIAEMQAWLAARGAQ